jgi:hypothetical protein
MAWLLALWAEQLDLKAVERDLAGSSSPSPGEGTTRRACAVLLVLAKTC